MRTDTTTLTVDEALAVAYGPNSLLETLGPNMSVDDLPARLSHCSLAAIPWQSVPTPQRYDFVKLLRSHFVPTPTALEIAQSIQRTLRMGYVERNPLNRQHRRKLHKITGLRGLGVAEAPWFPTYASGTVIKGITGLGKSTIVQRIFSLYPQVKEHGENEEAGWLQLKQIVHLTVSMSADPSRRGFLFNILAAIDEAVGDTTYHEEYFKAKSDLYQPTVRKRLETEALTHTSAEDYVRERWALETLRRTIDDAFTDFDLVVMPTLKTEPPVLDDMIKRNLQNVQGLTPSTAAGRGGAGGAGAPGGGGITSVGAYDSYGIPSLSIPCGFTKDGLPVGLMICGPHFTESKVFAVAHAYEMATKWHTMRPPITPETPVPPLISHL